LNKLISNPWGKARCKLPDDGRGKIEFQINNNINRLKEKKMIKNIGMIIIGLVLAVMMVGFAGSAAAQDTPADNMDIVKEKIRTDKKLFIVTNMQLTKTEAKNFMPVYGDYQAKLEKLVDRKGKLIEKFAANYETLSDDIAKSLLDNDLAIDSDYQKLRQSYLPKFRGVLSDKKVARFYQLESKIHALVEFELARRIPLVQ
jgi:cell division protein FtsB